MNRRHTAPQVASRGDDHPFHSLFVLELEFVKRSRNWRTDRVYLFDPDGARLGPGRTSERNVPLVPLAPGGAARSGLKLGSRLSVDVVAPWFVETGRVDTSVIALWLGHENVETTQNTPT